MRSRGRSLFLRSWHCLLSSPAPSRHPPNEKVILDDDFGGFFTHADHAAQLGPGSMFSASPPRSPEMPGSRMSRRM